MAYKNYRFEGLFVLLFLLCGNVFSMSRQQLKNSVKVMKKSCLGKIPVDEDMVAEIDKGKFIEDKNVMCYIACIYEKLGVVKNNKLNYEASIKQIDILYPADIKEQAKNTVTKCRETGKKYKDLCEVSYWTAQCIYQDDPKNFIFP